MIFNIFLILIFLTLLVLCILSIVKLANDPPFLISKGGMCAIGSMICSGVVGVILLGGSIQFIIQIIKEIKSN